MKTMHKTPFALAMGVSLLPSLTTGIAQADTNPFALTELSAGYLLSAAADADKDPHAKMKDGACGEGKCGGAMQQPSTSNKVIESKCAGNKPAAPATNEGQKAEPSTSGK